MHCVYLKSVRSPAVQAKFKMSYRNHHNMDIFSQVCSCFHSGLETSLHLIIHTFCYDPQVPEMDETYAEDSFVVGSGVEEEESSEGQAEEEVELMPEDTYVDGKRRYATRRRVFLHRARARAGATTSAQSGAGAKAKRSRVIRVSDSSDEEAEVAAAKQREPTEHCAVAVPLWSKVVPQETPSTSSVTVASKVSMLSKTQRRPVAEEKNQR